MSIASSWKTYGQKENLIASIRNIIKDYSFESIFREFIQNADDAGATRFHIIIDGRSHPSDSLFNNEMKAWQGPAILIFNNQKFEESDFESLMQLRVGGKQDDNTKIGKHGLGFNTCFHFTDVPSFISGDSIAFLDPQEKFLRQRGIIGPFPTNGIEGLSEKDQLVPFEGIEGINFCSTFEGTLFRIPLRREGSELSNRTFSIAEIFELFSNLKSTIPSQFLFLRNIETIEISQISETTVPLQIKPLCKVTMEELDETVKNKRRCEHVINGEFPVFQIKTKLIDYENLNNIKYNSWIIAIGAQQDPEDSQLQEYAKQYRLRVLGGVAAPLENPIDFEGKMYSFLLLSDTFTNLPVHLNGAWAQGSDRAMLLIEKNDIPDLDHLKLSWNRHILLDFLPKLHCKLLKEAIRLNITDPVSKFWFFPSQRHPKYAIEYGFKVLKYMLQTDTILFNDNSEENVNEHVNNFFECLSRQRIDELRSLLMDYWEMVNSDDELESLIRLFPIWPIYSNSNSEMPLKPASCGYLLPTSVCWYQTRSSTIYFCDYHQFLTRLNVPLRNIYSYVFQDVEFPSESNDTYVRFLNSVLNYNDVVQELRDKRCFPNSNTRILKKITDLFDPNNSVFRIVFGGNRNTDVFLHSGLLEHAERLSSIGFNNKVNEIAFNKCADMIEELQKEPEPPSDIRYRGFTLVDHLYKNITVFNLDNIRRIPIFPVAKSLGEPYDTHYNHNDDTRVFGCLNEVILPNYRDVAWSQMYLIAEVIIPPPQVLQRHPSFGKPNVSTVVKHLRFLYNVLRNDDEWRNSWADKFKHDVFEVYKWLDDETSHEGIDLSMYIRLNDTLFLNFTIDQNPFNRDNWVAAKDLILNREPGEDQYVNPMLARFPNMLKSAGVREIRPPNYVIRVKHHDQSSINRNRAFEFLLDQRSPLNDFTFIVNGEKIKASRFMLASSSRALHRELTANPNNSISIPTIQNIQPNSMRILLRYLYGQDIDDAIQRRDSINVWNRRTGYEIYNNSNLPLYKDLLKLAEWFQLDHLKSLMEFRLSRFVQMSNVRDMTNFAETLNAEQLKQYCYHFIRDNSELLL
ncbi:5154_t:CDS:2 [Funneliformis caledonium]|uniref:5154_t:CDS:1 n=1 Tax=Funneliformis caledonium TaxID=1117310 RepID=A0A9N9BQ09_9GLOM|nr:5154_t:CDS:2 [Funneliformis caledonium]